MNKNCTAHLIYNICGNSDIVIRCPAAQINITINRNSLKMHVQIILETLRIALKILCLLNKNLSWYVYNVHLLLND